MNKIEVQLTGHDGNIFSIMARVKKAMKKAGQGKEAEEMVTKVTLSKSYHEALGIISDYIEIS